MINWIITRLKSFFVKDSMKRMKRLAVDLEKTSAKKKKNEEEEEEQTTLATCQTYPYFYPWFATLPIISFRLGAC